MSEHRWNSVAGGSPTLTGQKRHTGEPAGRDDARIFQHTWTYGPLEPGPAVHVTVEIDRAPTDDGQNRMEFTQQVAGSSGHIVIPLPGIGDGALAVSDHKNTGRPNTTVLAATWSANAYISANVRLPGPINNPADLAAHTARLSALLQELLNQLRP